MYIVDCRPKLSAVGNMAKGLGYERADCYSENCEIIWMGVDNIHGKLMVLVSAGELQRRRVHP